MATPEQPETPAAVNETIFSEPMRKRCYNQIICAASCKCRPEITAQQLEAEVLQRVQKSIAEVQMRAKESMKVREEQLEEEVRRRVKGIVAESQARIRKMEIECETRLHTLKAQYQSRLSLIEGEYEERLKTMPARQATNSSAKLTTENSLRAILLYTSFKATYSRYTRSMEEFLHSIDLLQRVLLQKMLLPISSFDAFVGTGVKLSPITGVVHSESSKPVLHVVKWSEEEEGYFCREVVKPDNLMGLGEERSWKVDVSWDREVVLVI